MSGWIKLYRKILNSDLYRSLNSKQRDVLITILLMANHEHRKWEWNGEIFECAPGQFITSLANIQRNCAPDVSIRNIRTTLSKLEKWGFLTNKSTKAGRLITIIKWHTYQDSFDESDKESDKEVTKSRQRSDKEVTTNKNIKNDKKKKKNIYAENSVEFQLASFAAERIRSNHPHLKFSPEQLQKFAHVMHQLLELDGMTEDEIRNVVEWATADEFWAKQFLSPLKLRRTNREGVKYVDVWRANMQRDGPGMVFDVEGLKRELGLVGGEK